VIADDSELTDDFILSASLNPGRLVLWREGDNPRREADGEMVVLLIATSAC